MRIKRRKERGEIEIVRREEWMTENERGRERRKGETEREE